MYMVHIGFILSCRINSKCFIIFLYFILFLIDRYEIIILFQQCNISLYILIFILFDWTILDVRLLTKCAKTVTFLSNEI